jgi:hypothetical protein
MPTYRIVPGPDHELPRQFAIVADDRDGEVRSLLSFNSEAEAKETLNNLNALLRPVAKWPQDHGMRLYRR